MWLNKSGDKIIATFKYNADVVSAIKSIPGRKFNKKMTRWEIPVMFIKETLDALVPLGFNLHIAIVDEASKQIKLNKEIEDLRTNPGEYKGKLPLYDFQKIGASFMKAMPNSLLADVPGLGKTIQTIAALEDNPGPHLIIVPASLKYSWEEEINKWEPTADIVVINGTKEERKDDWIISDNVKYTIANYELLLRDVDLIKEIPWESIVCDEATRISNAQAKTTKVLRGYRENTGTKKEPKWITHLPIETKKHIALTGTPISNSPTDVYSIIEWLQPGYFGSYRAFEDQYCIMDDFADPTWRKVSGYKNLDQLSERVGRFMLRRTKEEVLPDLPPKTVENITFDLSPEERHAYTAVKNQIVQELHKLEVEGHNLHIIPVKMLRLKQITDDATLISDIFKGQSTKLDVLKELLVPVIASGDKAIIFSQFSTMALKLAEELEEYKPLLIYGDVSAPARQEAVLKFREDPERKIMIMTEAGAYGLNLQSASYVFHYDSPWSIAKQTQREDRSHRNGQTKPVTVYNLVAKNTIDEYVAKVLHKKQLASVEILKDFERLEEAGLSEEDIKNILKL